MPRALQRAFAAAGAFGIVDFRKVVVDMDGVVLAGLFTDLAADTADVADFAENRWDEQATLTSA